MAGPGRPDENPKDFSFLHSVPESRGPDSVQVPATTASAEMLSDGTGPPSASGLPFTALDENVPGGSPFQIGSESTHNIIDTDFSAPEDAFKQPEPEPGRVQGVRESRSAADKPQLSSVAVPRPTGSRMLPVITGYAIALTVFLIFCLMTGRLNLFGNAALESLPDIRPLDSNEFRKVPDGTTVPDGHVLKLGESRRFGDVVLTPVRVTLEPLAFQQFQTNAPEASLTTTPVLKLWLRFENQSTWYGFPPFDAGLMSHRTPAFSADESTVANSWLRVMPTGQAEGIRVLNYLQTMDSPFVLAGQQAGKVLLPGEAIETFIACSEDVQKLNMAPDTRLTWRIQIRKGVHYASGHGVTTLVEVPFEGSDVTQTVAGATGPASG